jgi:hypothetical protein
MNTHPYFKIHAKHRHGDLSAALYLPALFLYTFFWDSCTEEVAWCQRRDDIPGTWSDQWMKFAEANFIQRPCGALFSYPSRWDASQIRGKHGQENLVRGTKETEP